MYLPPHFSDTEQAALDLIDARPLASLVAHTETGMVANAIPLLREADALIGHVAEKNDLHRMVPDGATVLAIFHGDDAYISPNWYPSKPAHHRAVPTWNYQLVQVHAALHWVRDDAGKRRIVHRLTSRFERETNGDAAWKMGDAPADFMETMIAGIVGFRLTPTAITAKSKLSQNRDPADQRAVRDALEPRAPGVSAAMRDHSRQ